MSLNLAMNGWGKFKFVLWGMLFGFLAYSVYLLFFTQDEVVAAAIGWVFFTPQYLIFWLNSWTHLAATAETISAYCLIVLFYGYAFLSFKLAPRLWLGWFITSGLLFLLAAYWQHAATEGSIVFLTILFWQAEAIRDGLHDLGFSNHVVRLLIESFSVGFYYATLINGVRGFFLLIKPERTTKQLAQNSTAIINCPECHQPLRIRGTSREEQFRCPSCKSTFHKPSAV